MLKNLKQKWRASAKMHHDIYRLRYLSRNDTIVNIIFHDLDLQFQGQTFLVKLLIDCMIALWHITTSGYIAPSMVNIKCIVF